MLLRALSQAWRESDMRSDPFLLCTLVKLFQILGVAEVEQNTAEEAALAPTSVHDNTLERRANSKPYLQWRQDSLHSCVIDLGGWNRRPCRDSIVMLAVALDVSVFVEHWERHKSTEARDRSSCLLTRFFNKDIVHNSNFMFIFLDLNQCSQTYMFR